MRALRTLVVAICVLGSPGMVAAQDQPPAAPCPCPPEPDKGAWVGSAGFGFSMNRGNTDTTNVNLSFEATYDPKKRDVWKMLALYLRGETNGEATVDRLFLQGRYERNLTDRLFAFGQLQYLRDEFKDIDYLVAPVGGIGYKLINTEELTLAVDAGAGVKWEKNPGLDVETSATITSGDRFEWKVSKTATITQGLSVLWDADDFGDALYTFAAGVAATIVKQLELKVELLDTYASQPPDPILKKNDVGVITALIWKF
jgi:putative salt-induced outer membrane protein